MTAEEVSDPWPARFARKHGRKPRVLHIGNVANYAYVNAKIQRRHGIETYVMDPDFYHLMSSPEWLEADFDAIFENEFFPRWSKVDLKGYRRPEWFAQGPFDLCRLYLQSLIEGRRVSAFLARTGIDLFRDLNPIFIATGDRPKGLREWSASFLIRQAINVKRLRDRLYRAKSSIRSRQASAPLVPPIVPESSPLTVRQVGHSAERYRALFRHFDVIQGYTVSALTPLASGMRNVVAYELGTIRGLPFEDSEMGRVTKWVYQTAPEVIITNIDCIPAAERLGIEPIRRHLCLHAYDTDAAISYSRNPQPSPLAGEGPYFFAPARHHWKEGNESWLKGNDVLIRAAAEVKRQGHAFRLVFVSWGQELDLSKQLIRECELEDRVIWLPPLPVSRVWSIYCGAAAVLDQFRAPAFGGVSLDTMALGRRLITGYDAEMGAKFFHAPPPIFNARTVEQVSSAMIAVLSDPDDRQGRGAANQRWFEVEHSVEKQLHPQFEIYARLLEEDEPTSY